MDSHEKVKNEQQELQELIELKKLKQAAAEHQDISDKLPKQEEVILPQTFREKWDNYWYHYKLVTWLGVFVVFVAGWMIKDVFFSPKYDITVNIASKYAFSSVNEDMGAEAALYIEDYDGDGKRSVLVNEMQVNYDGTGTGNPQESMVGEQKILAILNAGEDLVFVLEQQTYDQLIGGSDGESIFADLSERYPDYPELVDGDKILIQQTELGKKWRMNTVNSPLYLCVRKLEGNVKNNEKTHKKYEEALYFVDHVVAGEPTA